ncbi:thiamine pyrophosphate-binding protein [Pseudohongiella sp. O18]|uniref:thiamine pyrophosphate-binding protein n=1 Tax=Pseudohongiella sp. O18 TaxID=2904248 RepID=UPI001F371CBD|nr:thiamine pyrophosphate-binding protein [Pseudohongiella sp. O18]
MTGFYTDEKNAQIVISLLKSHGIKRVIASPGGTNMALVGSMQRDSFFILYSAVDERSAAYMACGLAHETGEPVVISCTGATASRNYMPGMTEAYYRKLPVLAITSVLATSKVGHLVAQVIDRSTKPKDVAKFSVSLPIVKDDEDIWECEVKVNQAILELWRHGGGPVHINLPTVYSRSYNVSTLPKYRKIERIKPNGIFPPLRGKVAVVVGSHRKFSASEQEQLDQFCASNDAVVFCDHTSSYNGAYKVQFSLVATQSMMDRSADKPDITIHIGEISGDYPLLSLPGKEVWRVSEDGEIRDTFRKLSYVFEMDESTFFANYSNKTNVSSSYLNQCLVQLEEIRNCIPDLPFSNIWIASRLAAIMPENCVIHFGILHSLRSWNLFDLPPTVTSASNVGGFGIDGSLSSVLGASLADDSKIYYCILGDLAFFYDINALGNRHIGRNLRILLVNNGKGTEFRNYSHAAAHFGEEADAYISAAGHFGSMSRTLVKNISQDFGFEYLSASNKVEFDASYSKFIDPLIQDRPILFEVFTDSEEESDALEAIRSIKRDPQKAAKTYVKKIMGDKSVRIVKRILKK